jgi:hypothetical protein
MIHSSAHGVVSGSVARADNQRQMRNPRVGNCVDHLRSMLLQIKNIYKEHNTSTTHHQEFHAKILFSHLNDSSLFVFCADHKPGDIVNKQDWCVLLIAQMNKLRRFQSRFREYHSVKICNYTNQKALNACPSTENRSAVEWLELRPARAVNNASKNLSFEKFCD